MTELSHPARADIRIEAVLQALADPIRLRIVRELDQVGEPGIPCGAIELPITRSTRTHHLRILREAGVIRMRPVATTRMTWLRRDDLDALYPGLLAGVLAGLADDEPAK